MDVNGNNANNADVDAGFSVPHAHINVFMHL
jgi:hypothetical protein